jgi:hypothetical protein
MHSDFIHRIIRDMLNLLIVRVNSLDGGSARRKVFALIKYAINTYNSRKTLMPKAGSNPSLQYASVVRP